MKDSMIIVIAGAILVGFLVVFKFNTQVATGAKILTPQPSQNYSGYLAATTAPAVGTALSGLISGFGSAATAWLKGTPTAPVTPPNPPQSGSPTAAAAPVGPQLNTQSNFIAGLSTYSDPGSTLVGPQSSPSTSYDATSGAAFNFGGLSADNYPTLDDLQFSV